MIKEIKITSLSGRGDVTIRQNDHEGYWLGPVDWGQVEGQHQTYSYYNQVGANIVSTIISSRAISITGWVIDAGDGTTLRERCDFLNTFISPTEDYDLEYEGKKISFRPDNSVIYSREYKQNNELVRKFLIQATCPHPLFSDSNETKASLGSLEKRFIFPTDWGQNEPLVLSTSSKFYEMEVYNTGGFQTGFKATIQFKGEVKNPKLYNVTTDKFIGISRLFSKGERLEISTMPGNKSLILYTTSGEEINMVKYRQFGMSWFQIMPGKNIIALECDNPEATKSMTLSILYTPLYLEVE